MDSPSVPASEPDAPPVPGLLVAARATIDVALPMESNISEAFAAIIATVMRTNALRCKAGRDCIRPVRITIDCEQPDLSPDERQLLVKGQALTAFRDGPPFQSMEEVVQFCTPAIHSTREEFHVDLKALAQVIIKSRVHCQF